MIRFYTIVKRETGVIIYHKTEYGVAPIIIEGRKDANIALKSFGRDYAVKEVRIYPV